MISKWHKLEYKLQPQNPTDYQKMSFDKLNLK